MGFVSQKHAWSRQSALPIIAAVMLVGTLIVAFSLAASPLAAFETEVGAISAGASVVTVSGASNGQVVKFASPATPPPGARACPAYPAFPDGDCTGIIPGTQLATCATNLSVAGKTYDKCQFNGNITVNAANITITNSKILGVIAGQGASVHNLQMIDVEIDGKNSTLDATQGISDYSCLRCNIHHAAKGFSGDSFTVIDSYVHDIYGSSASHNEALLGSSGNITARHNRFQATWAATGSNGGAMSSAVSFYTHGDFWPPLSNVVFEQNYLQAVEGYCLYAGDDTGIGDQHQVSNAVFRNNVFKLNSTNPKRCGSFGAVTEYYAGNGNVWHNNTYDDGTLITP